jgi:hypothetical protein
MAAANGIQWPDLRTPPINLWVMPVWKESDGLPSASHQQRANKSAVLSALTKSTAGTVNFGEPSMAHRGAPNDSSLPWRRDAYRDVARPAPQRKAAAAKILDRHIELLAARAGNGEKYGHQD